MAGAHGAASTTASAGFESPTGAWFIELSGSADAFRGKARAAGLSYSERFEFKRLWHGLSVNADAGTAELMRRLPGVVAVHPVGIVTLDPVQQLSEPELAHAIAMTGADIAQNELGLSGDGIQVGIMDTGIDYDNPALGGCFGAGCRVTTGWDIVGDSFNASGSGGALRPHPDDDPDDCNGHGTHVAGIVGADGTVNGATIKGVAPGVTFGAYRVFGCTGSTTEDVMIEAMERAQADGMDIVNMSIGDAFAWDTEPFAEAMNNAVAEGTVVVISAGNSGTNGLYSLSSAGNARDVIGVASIDNSHVELRTFTAEPDDASFGYGQATASPTAPTSGTMALTRSGTPTTANDACNVSGVSPFAPGSLTGKAVLIRRGTCTFHEKAVNAQNAGAIAVVLYNNVAGRFGATVAGPVTITIPVVSVSDTEGANLSGRIPTALTDTVDITWTDQRGTFQNATAGLLSSFTSWGLAPSLNLKPDIAAPGGLIKSTWPMEAGGFATISGTSMAAPHVAGAAALYLEEHGPTDPLALREILQNSADPIIAGTIGGIPAAFQTHRQGAGVIDIDDAITATTRVSPGKWAYGEGTTEKAFDVSITNNGSAARTYNLEHRLAVGTTNNTYAPGLATNIPTVSFSATSVDVPAGETRTVTVAVTPNAAAVNNRRIFGGYVRITSSGEAPMHVPFAGFTGDYQTIQVLAPGACSFPGVFKAGGSTTCGAATLNGWTRQADGATYDVGDSTDRPIVLFHLAHQSQQLDIYAVNAANESVLVARSTFVERSPAADLSPPGTTSPGFFAYTWDGKAVFTNSKNGIVTRRELPSGTYKLRLVVTKALAEAGNPAHTETRDLATMNIVSGG